MRVRVRLALAGCLLAAAAGAAEPPVPRPARPDGPVERAAPPAPRPSVRATPRRAGREAPEPRIDAAGGALCGDRRLAGAQVPPVEGPGGCGVAQAVRLERAAGVTLDPPVTVGCGVSRRLADWIEGSVQPAARAERGAPVVELRTFAGYACRPRNSQRGARPSLHGLGQAIDIGAFRFSNGAEVTVLDGWRAEGSSFLRRVWRGACGPFGTVLGPNADRWHVNHLHLDVASYRTGPVCR